jgi:DNA-binding CsgD family transcriptional regulator
VREFAQQARRERCALLQGGCAEYLGTPYEPFVEALVGDDRNSPLENDLRGLNAQRTVAPEVERLRRFQLVEDHLRRRAASAGSIVLVVDDLHWSDAATLELWRYLARKLADAPVLMIGTARSDEVARDAMRSTQIARAVREGTVELVLEPLDGPEMRRLVRAALTADRPLEQRDVETIVERAEGIPLIAEELLKSALEGARDDSGAPRLPGSVGASIRERFAELGAPEREALLAAAVAGREFDAGLIAQLVPLSEEGVLRALREARNLQLVVERPDGAFRFRHAITRETLYNELLLGEARILHRRIAELLERSPAGPQDEIAYHWWAAGDAGRAVASNEAAGDRYSAMYAYADAARSYERALEFASDDVLARIVNKGAFALCAIGEMPRARTWSQAGAAELRRLGQEHEALRFMLWAARQLYESGDAERALETVELVRTELRERPPSNMHYAAAMTLASMLATLGRAPEALATLDEADRFEGPRDEADRFRSHNARANALCSLGAFTEAGRHYAAALAIAEELGDVVLRLHALGNIANAALLTGDLTKATATYATALALAERHGLRRQANMLRADAGVALLNRGDLAAALETFRAVIATRAEASMSVGLAWAVGLRLRGLVDAPDVDALDVEATVAMALQLRESQVIAAVAGAAARAALECGERDRARAIAELALPALAEPDHAYWLCDAAAATGDEALAGAARALLLRAGAGAENPLADAFLLLFDARRASGAEATALARRAADAFALLGWELESAAALELAGETQRAREIATRLGATRAAQRLQPKAGASAGQSAAGGLTRREREVAELAARGYSNRTIADEIGIGERTVETHLAVAYRKLGVRSRTELAALFGAPG